MEKGEEAANSVDTATATEINVQGQYSVLAADVDRLDADTLTLLKKIFAVQEQEITGVELLKKGMTNRSFLFNCRGDRYIVRVPGAGTDKLIDRCGEEEAYRRIAGLKLSDEVVYIDSSSGYKVSRYIFGSRVCDPQNFADVKRCMEKLRWFHELQLTVKGNFDIFEKINFYEALWLHSPSFYEDYAETKAKVLSLKKFIDGQPLQKCLTHIDAVSDNFIFYTDDKGAEQLRLLDWEYAAMQDPHADIAMFAIYALYERPQIDSLIELYFKGKCEEKIRTKIYCYIAACGLLWSNWCEYKRDMGEEFGIYAQRQYRYAQDFSKLAAERIARGESR